MKFSIGVSFARHTVTKDRLRTVNVPVHVQIRGCTSQAVHTIRNSSVLYCTNGTSSSLVKDRSSCHHVDYSGIRSISSGAGSNHGPCLEMEVKPQKITQENACAAGIPVPPALYLYTTSTAPGPLAMGLCVKCQMPAPPVGCWCTIPHR